MIVIPITAFLTATYFFNIFLLIIFAFQVKWGCLVHPQLGSMVRMVRLGTHNASLPAPHLFE
jgi:hypothetical protein